jgi:hypothetical protein
LAQYFHRSPNQLGPEHIREYIAPRVQPVRRCARPDRCWITRALLGSSLVAALLQYHPLSETTSEGQTEPLPEIAAVVRPVLELSGTKRDVLTLDIGMPRMDALTCSETDAVSAPAHNGHQLSGRAGFLAAAPANREPGRPITGSDSRAAGAR